ncbi:hypothetical protein QQF64_030157 [Cirrhinus molitorella]|uniref:Uncharacterized protein n=1 Tax=Cirrhinus molitorella TaxID=172907 RepID=A0ABR3N2U0_9TELE
MIVKGRKKASSISSMATVSLYSSEYKILPHDSLDILRMISCVSTPGQEKSSARAQPLISSTLSFLLLILDHNCGCRICKQRYKLIIVTVIRLEYTLL